MKKQIVNSKNPPSLATARSTPFARGIQGISANPPLKKGVPEGRGIFSLVLCISLISYLLSPSSVSAVNNVPAVDLNSPSFHLLQCDGPDLSGLPKDTKITINGKSYTIEGKNPQITNADGSNPHQYQPCNFQGLMIEVQYLLNVMTIVAVLMAIVGFAIAGYLYITGIPKNIEKARGMFPKLAIGFILILTAWFIVYQILAWLTGNAGAAALLGNGS